LEPLIADQLITEIMINGYDKIFVEKSGKLEKSDIVFKGKSHYESYVRKLVESCGKNVNELEPLVNGRLSDNSRINVVIPPIVDSEPVVTIRKFWRKIWWLKDLQSIGALSEESVSFLLQAVKNRKNIIVCGAAGVGKTTMINALAREIPESERVVVIEDVSEIRMYQENVVHMETRPVNVDGRGEVSLRRLVRNALHMRPDRLILGEVLGEEALDVLQAMNTGHDGSLTTVHANSPKDAIARLETLVLMAGMDLPLSAIRNQICSAVDVIVQTSRLSDGSRKVVGISEITGIENGDGTDGLSAVCDTASCQSVPAPKLPFKSSGTGSAAFS
jgi:pilus assembly protein CpaF